MLLIAEPDLGTAIALVLMLVAMLLVAGHAVRASSAPRSASPSRLGTLAIWLEPYRRARFFAFLHPWHDAQGTGFQIVQAMIGMGSGGIFGVGLGQGVQKIFYLPEAHTDMMLANIGEELGLVGVTAVHRRLPRLRLCRAARSRSAAAIPFGKRLAVGLTVLVCGQACGQHRGRDGGRAADGNPAAVPLLRRLELVVLLASVGILLNIAQRGNAATASVRDRGRRDGRSRAVGARGRGSADGTRRVRDVRRVAGSRRGAARS